MTGLYNSKRDARKQAKRLSGTVKKVLWYSKRGHLRTKWLVTYPWPPNYPSKGGEGGAVSDSL